MEPSRSELRTSSWKWNCSARTSVFASVTTTANPPSGCCGGFEIVDGRVPPNWDVRFDEDGTIRLSPAAWHREGFWWAYFQGDLEAEETFRRESERMASDVA